MFLRINGKFYCAYGLAWAESDRAAPVAIGRSPTVQRLKKGEARGESLTKWARLSYLNRAFSYLTRMHRLEK